MQTFYTVQSDTFPDVVQSLQGGILLSAAVQAFKVEDQDMFSYLQVWLPMEAGEQAARTALQDMHSDAMAVLEASSLRAMRAALLGHASAEDNAKLAEVDAACAELRQQLQTALIELGDYFKET